MILQVRVSEELEDRLNYGTHLMKWRKSGSGVAPVKQGESRLYFSLVPLKAVDKGKDFCAFAL